jgi:hypothetical protein
MTERYRYPVTDERAARPVATAEAPSRLQRVKDGLKAVAAIATTGAVVACAAPSPSHSAEPSKVADSPSASPTPHVSPSHNRLGFTNTFVYAGALQQTPSEGASVKITQAQPEISPQDYHTLMEMAVMSADEKQVVEVGWRVDPTDSGDDKPHLFTFHWVDNQPTCYNSCDFVQVSNEVQPGMEVEPGIVGTYGIKHAVNQWQVWYNGEEVGYYPDNLWGDRYKIAGEVEVFGEIAEDGLTAEPTCTDMGNGRLDGEDGATFTDFTLHNAVSKPALVPYTATTAGMNLEENKLHPLGYGYDHATATSVLIGGPGNGLCTS